jgi:plastocyanin
MPRSMWLFPPRVLVAALVTGLVAGCGGGSETVVDHDRVLRLTLDEYRIEPARIEVQPGRLHIVARNAGRLTHNVVVERTRDSEDSSPQVLERTDTAHPGQTVSRSVTLAPGTYRLVCTIANHENLGQYATLYVRDR